MACIRPALAAPAGRGNYPAMCGPYASFLAAEAIARIFGAVNLRCRTCRPSWNVTPTNDCAIVGRHPQTGQRHLDPLTWGVPPYWTKEPAKACRPINACPETGAKRVGQNVTARAFWHPTRSEDRSLLSACLHTSPYPHEITLGDHLDDCLPRVGKDRRVLPAEIPSAVPGCGLRQLVPPGKDAPPWAQRSNASG